MPITRRRRANSPDQPEENNHRAEQSAENSTEVSSPEQPTSATPAEPEHGATFVAERPEADAYQPFLSPPLPTGNGDRVERQEYIPSIEPGRRTARGELFRRAPQLPPAPQSIATSVTPIAQVPEPPSHEINLPLGNLLHLAYNPGYTASDEARSTLLRQLAAETKAGGRARCWNCGSVAIAYECWNIRNKTFGEIGIAFCEICGVWSVM
ncbi:MAG: hypothetical protein JO202_17415 [Ktedonobacteraceae bacterium]|nr:hypothetical protein [Ktedonobacteraceae bacterium]